VTAVEVQKAGEEPPESVYDELARILIEEAEREARGPFT
jgi:hypothetical protein